MAELLSENAVLHGQPHAIVERDGVRYTLLGTAHVSQASVEVVREAIAGGGYDAIAVELDGPRLQALSDPPRRVLRWLPQDGSEPPSEMVPGEMQTDRKGLGSRIAKWFGR